MSTTKEEMASRKVKKRRLTARERGYFPRADAAKSLRDLAATLEQPSDGSLVKFSLNVWATPDDEPDRVPHPDDYCEGRDCRACSNPDGNCTCPCHAPTED